MFVNFKGSILGVIRWQWKAVLQFIGGSSAIVLGASYYNFQKLTLPTLPLVVVGAALGIFTSFRTNACYDRWWEGRKLWGRLINTSRHFSTQILSLLPCDGVDPTPLQARLIRRHVAYVHTLRVLLRKQDLARDEDFLSMVPEGEAPAIVSSSNPTHALLQSQANEIALLANDGKLDELRLQSLDESIRHLLDIQGGCERIKNTPFPRSYGWLAERLTLAYSLLFPLAVMDSLGWLTIPLTVLVCLCFTMINETGRVLEDPFTVFWSALPLSALSRTIEVNLRERLNESNLPPLLRPDDRGILM